MVLEKGQGSTDLIAKNPNLYAVLLSLDLFNTKRKKKEHPEDKIVKKSDEGKIYLCLNQ